MSKSKSFSYSFKTSKTPEEMYVILLNVKKWWSGLYNESINGKSKKEGDEFSFKAGNGAHYSKQRLTELKPNRKIVWQVIDSNLSFLTHTTEWVDTKIRFDISKEGTKTKVTFTHQGLIPKFECYGACSNGWTGYLKKLEKSLK
ncbi:MAG: SRPBCC family protein [Bacteroidia bacterium]